MHEERCESRPGRGGTAVSESTASVVQPYITSSSWCREAHYWNTNPLGYDLWMLPFFFCVTVCFSVSSQLGKHVVVSRWVNLSTICIFLSLPELLDRRGVQRSAKVTGFSNTSSKWGNQCSSDPLTTGCLHFLLLHLACGSHIAQNIF